MASKMTSLRVDEGLLEWATEYAAERGVSRSELLEGALANFREDCERGVPEIRRMAAEQASLSGRHDGAGVGDCPDRPGELGHLWRVDAEKVNRCRFCGTLGQEFLKVATRERAELFARLRTPASIKGEKVKK